MAMKSPISAALVRLHRPLPLTRIFRPQRSVFSSKSTRAPARAAAEAAIIPAAPPPITTRSASAFPAKMSESRTVMASQE